MKSALSQLFLFMLFISCGFFSIFIGGCAQIGAPTGGVRDTLPPVLVRAEPMMNATSVNNQQLQLQFDEYIELQDVSKQVLVSPFPKENPSIQYNLKNVRIRLKDSLKPETTYIIDFGNSIRDINEANSLMGFKYVFSTGKHIDSLNLVGSVSLAETGLVDSTMFVLLYEDVSDTAVLSRPPDYMARLNGQGQFSFSHLPNRPFQLFALKDGDGNKRYSNSSELFAFADTSLQPATNPQPVSLLAYAETKAPPPPPTSTPASTKADPNKPLRYTPIFHQGSQDLFKPLEIRFTSPLKSIQLDSIQLTDTANKILTDARIRIDSTQKSLFVDYEWKSGQAYRLISTKNALVDSTGKQFAKNDTLSFFAKRKNDYGSLRLQFNKLDTAQHPVLILREGDIVLFRVPLTKPEWSVRSILPGEYGLEVLYDRNQNGFWDPGNYRKRLQPERVQSFQQKLSIRADWENDRTLELN
jgi:hypothetical protein